MREYLTMVCKECSNRNYRTQKKTQQTTKLELRKYCKFCGKHTDHKEYKK